MALIKSVSGIRGIAGSDLTPENLTIFASAFATFLKENYSHSNKIIIGRDTRVTGEAVNRVITGALMFCGMEVIDLGIVPTPTVLFWVKKMKAAGGLAISASHNPEEWNALKLINGKPTFLDEKEAKTFLKYIEEEKVNYVDYKKTGKVSVIEKGVSAHIDAILELPFIDTELIRSKKFKVVLDAVNGAGSVSSNQLLNKLGCELIEMNCIPNGLFPRIAEPLAENLGGLEEMVALHDADIGFANDPDVDRLSVVSGEGKAVGEEYTLALSADFLLPKLKTDIVTNLSTSLMVNRLAEDAGKKVVRTRIGEVNVATEMMSSGALIGGEGNGGLIIPQLNYTRDALAAMAVILQYMAESGKTLAELVSKIPSFVIQKDKIRLSAEIDLPKVLGRIKDEYSVYDLNELDGLKITGGNFWIHIRQSATEPIIRIYAEAPDRETALGYISRIKDYFN